MVPETLEEAKKGLATNLDVTSAKGDALTRT